ncbi:MAG: RidA family protein [Nitrososphaeria archaeon]
MKKEILLSKKFPISQLPIAPAVIAGPFVFVSGQGPHKTVGQGIKEQTKEVIEIIKEILEECHTSLDNILQMTVYLSDMNNYSAMNEVFSEYFKNSPPARTCVQVVRIPRDVLVEIDAIAIIPEK